MPADDFWKFGDRGLRAGVQAETPRRDHDALEKAAIVHPTADLEPPIDGENHAERRAEEIVVGGALLLHALLLAPLDAERAIKAPTARAAASEIGIKQRV